MRGGLFVCIDPNVQPTQHPTNPTQPPKHKSHDERTPTATSNQPIHFPHAQTNAHTVGQVTAMHKETGKMALLYASSKETKRCVCARFYFALWLTTD